MSSSISVDQAVRAMLHAEKLGVEQGPQLNACMAGVDEGFSQLPCRLYRIVDGNRHEIWGKETLWYRLGWTMGNLLLSNGNIDLVTLDCLPGERYPGETQVQLMTVAQDNP